MTEASSNLTDQDSRRAIISWLSLPLSFFPLLALLTYDWRAIPALCTPAAHSVNWIGPLGDKFAYYGYQIFGLAIWIVPIACVIAATCLLSSKRERSPWTRRLWLFAFILFCACFIQSIGDNNKVFHSIAVRNNLQNIGGAIGYLITTKLLTPLISNFCAATILSLLMIASLFATIGLNNLQAFASLVHNWVLKGRDALGDDPAEAAAIQAERERMEAIRAARRAAEEERIEEKRRMKEAKAIERQRAKEEKARNKAMANAPIADTDDPGDAGANPADPNDKGPYMLPSVALLGPAKTSVADHGDVNELSQKLVDTLKLFEVNATLAYTVQGPVVTKYALNPEPGTRPERFLALQNTLMMALKAKSLRIEAPIPGEDKIGIEVPNKTPAGITFREIVDSSAWKNFNGELPLLFGKDAAGKELIADLASMPHMLVAGATGQGKSVCLNSIINGLLMTKTPDELKLIMVDPKSVEFTSYTTLPHLIVPVINDNKKVIFSLKWAVQEMEKRLKLFQRARVRNIYDFNHREQFTQTDMFGEDSAVGSDLPRTVPYIVIIIDEVADLMSSNGKEVTPFIARLTAKSRAAGIHLILATQRPDAKIITGTIKANIPGRVAFKTATAIDSRTILDDSGAENLIGRGDMLFKGKDGILIRAQGAFISDPEIASIIRFIEQHSNVQFDDRFSKKLDTIKDEEVDLFADPEAEEQKAKEDAATEREQIKASENASDFKKAIECIINTNRASTSHFQRKMGWGYNHSAKIIDMLEDAGIIGPQVGAGPRSIIMDQQQLIDILNGSADPENGTAPSEEPTSTDDAQDGDLFTEENT